jgi:hypothetical protein
MTQTQFTIPSTTFPVGTTRQSATVTGVVNNYDVSCDASAWTLAATVLIIVESSTDGGITWHLDASVGPQVTPPPWQGDEGSTSILGFSSSYSVGHSPDHVRITVTVTGHSVTLGPTVVTVN